MKYTTTRWLLGRAVLGLLAAVAGYGFGPPSAFSADDTLSFNRDVRPILSDKCFFCHGPDEEERAAGLRLDQADSAHGYAVVPGEPEESELIARITADDPGIVMPPPDTGKEITAEEQAILRRWIEQGGEFQPHWAYVPPKIADVPDVSADPGQIEPPAGPIDQFVRAGLEEVDLEPSSRASRREQLRRLSLDLTGLPPTYEQIRRFENDTDPDAYQREVDRLLSSPAFGERLAEYWLDLVRFADTVGYHGDQDHNIDPYRDYVINAFNDNKPLDEFSREQLAGDLLPSPTTEQLIATGYNRLLQTTHEGGLQPKEYLAIYAADRVRNFSAVWMGATMGCAQCHDHKYDPFTAVDFYSLSAFFADIDEAKHFKNGTNSLPTRREPEIDVLSRVDRMRLSRVEAAIEEAKADGDAKRLEALRAQREEINSRRRRTMVTEAIEPRLVRFLPRGNWLDDSGDVMQPSVPKFMGDLHESFGIESDRRLTRMDLANWLFDTEDGVGGLTARVFANRFWYLYMGRGISSSLGDFGGQGNPPTNPELLDYLALQFVRGGWDVKSLIREIVTSETYRQRVLLDESRRTADPYNDYASTQSSYRLPAETVRDVTLEIAGLLDHRVGGESVHPYQPAGYYRHLNFPRRRYKPDSGAKLWRRGVYTHWQRQFLHPTMKALDAPSREECTAQRPRSNTPLEALALLNDPTFVIAAKAFAARVLRETDVDPAADPQAVVDQRIHHAMRIAVGRDANQPELQALRDLFRQEFDRYRQDKTAQEEFLALNEQGMIAWPESSSTTERAAWSSVTRAILNLHETLYRP